jgi:hypothetical protein
MVDGIDPKQFLDALSSFGFAGLIFVIWYFSRNDTQKVLDQYQKDMAEQRAMYQNNVILVENYKELSSDLKNIIILNTQTITEMCTMLKQSRRPPNE